MVTVLRPHSTFILAPVRGFDASPATDLPHGVDSAFVYIDNPEQDIPTGFYTLRITAEDVKVGAVTGTVKYLDRRGHVAHEASIQLDVASLTVPDLKPFPHTVISLESRAAHPAMFGMAAVKSADEKIVCCPNGYCWFER